MTSANDTPPPAKPDLVQMNVRVPRELRDQIDARRAQKDMSRDKWVANALRFALAQHAAGTPMRATPTKRTAPPPTHR